MSISRVPRLTSTQPIWALTEDQQNFGCLRSQRGALPLSELRIQLSIRGLDYSLRLTQTFVNVHSQSLEAVYIFPLPARGAVSGFRMQTQDREIQGLLQERSQARRGYREAVAAGQQAALVEEERPEIFTMTVGNLPAQQSVTVHLELDGPLSCMDEVAIFRFPLVVAPRFIPGQALPGKDVGQGTSADTDQVPDASRITPPVLLPGYPNPVRLAVEVLLDSPLMRWQDLQSTLPLQVEGQGEPVRLVYAPETGRIDHDFLLVMPFEPDKMKSSLQVQSHSLGSDGHLPFCLTLVPPGSLSQQTPPKDVVILLDRSGSMNGWALEGARRTVARLLESLNSRDSFCILAFHDQCQEVRPVTPEASPSMFKLNQKNSRMVEASAQNTCDFKMALQKIEAHGGTQLLPALREALQRLGAPQKNRERHLVLLTDGLLGNEGEILAMLERQARGVRIFPVGISSAVNAGFLEHLAQSTGGLCQLVHNEEELDRSMTQICRRIGSPCLRDIRIQDLAVKDLVFQHNDLYPGLATRIYGRLPQPVPASLKLVGTSPTMAEPQQLEIPIQTCQGDTVEKLWAREKVLQMEYAFSVGDAQAPTPAAITAASLQYGVLCRFTAFLAADASSCVPVQVHSQIQPVSAPAGWQADAEEAQYPVPSGGGTIRVDLLPTERRSFELPSLLALLMLPLILPVVAVRFLITQGMRALARQKSRRIANHLKKLLQVEDPDSLLILPQFDRLLVSLSSHDPGGLQKGRLVRAQLHPPNFTPLQDWLTTLV